MSVTAAEGFVAAGGSVGIKAGGAADLAVVATEDGQPVPAAGVFTANLATAAPVQVSRAHLAATGGSAAGVVLTSGNANAATGRPGLDAAERLCQLVAGGLGTAAEQVLVCQTGLIGVPFPLAQVESGVAAVVAGRAGTEAAGVAAAEAIMTTDTVRKEAVATGPTTDGGRFTVGGMAKGAAMLAPDMATMLAVVTTDAAADADTLQQVLRAAVGPSFNTLSVDGCTSTNDTVLLLASGRAGPVAPDALQAAVTEVCTALAEQMADDAEGATKVGHVTVAGATSDADAHAAARKVADSLLVKCSLNGEDPYWGRVVSELGSAGVPFDLDRVSVAYGDVVVCAAGVAADHDTAAVAAHMAGRHIRIHCDLGLGTGSGAALCTDLGYGYIDENRTTS
ncbi:MAG TPA: bifunctional glutamate N-acetyltransferase/amino-acid acetyltransferase ArgJ [Acidimicrobiales bacterium]|nr:bifunctional glutamate N-acetyltransferase/amino-acid acetyltransferase ArgJ [Acidimicrobiales bacterium]